MATRCLIEVGWVDAGPRLQQDSNLSPRLGAGHLLSVPPIDLSRASGLGMHEHVTLLHPDDHPQDRGPSSGLPQDLLEQVRGRVRLLALLMLFAFALDPLLFFGGWAVSTLNGTTLPSDFFRNAAFYWSDLSVVVASAVLWWLARGRRVLPSTQLLALGLLYEVAICFIIALTTYWPYYRDKGILPNLTWVPAVVILFPLILPVPPDGCSPLPSRPAAMAPLALLVLDLTGKVPVGGRRVLRGHHRGGIVRRRICLHGRPGALRLGREVAAARRAGELSAGGTAGAGGHGRGLAGPPPDAGPAGGHQAHSAAARAMDGPGLENAMRRFEREAQVIARLRSPHTVDLFDFGVADNGAFYYVMELLEGLDADTLVRRFGPVPAERAIYLLRQVCHSLSEAESCGLVHRDIKPANIFLCRYGEDCDFVKVLDFGLVKAFDEAGGGRSGAHPGEPGPRDAGIYRAGAGDGASRLDGRVDIYATGCVALLAADRSAGVHRRNRRWASWCTTSTTPPTPPSARSEMPIPRGLDRLILSCLAKDPAERPQSARELSRRARGDRGRERLDRGTGPGVVAQTSAGERLMARSTPFAFGH